MRAGLSTIQQTLTPEAASVLNHSIAEASRRNHGQTTPLHVAATLLASPTGFLRQACIKSHPNSSHPLQCRALELCFSVALERLPTAQNSGPGIDPPISNALMAALKRAQAHQRRGCPEQQQQPLLAVKVELEQLIISILDDPSVSRVMREASFSSPAVKATIEQSLNSTSTNSSISGPIGLGFRPVQAGGPSPNRNPYLNPRLQQSAAAAQQSGQPRGEVVQKVIDILLGGRRKNVVLVGASEPERVVKEVLWKIESKEIGDGSLRNVEVIRLNIEPGSDQIVAKIKELGALVETRIGKLESGGVILDLGDLKWLVGQQAGFGAVSGLPQQQVVPEGGRAAVAEMARLLARVGDGVGGRVWLIGTATCETYLRCQIHHPSMENDWDLQAVPIASRTPLQGLFPRIGQNGLLGSSAESMPSLRGLSMTSGQQRCLTDSFDQSKKASGLCPQCLQNYEQELARMEACKELEKSSDKLESAKSALPQWLQNAKVQDTSAKSTDQLKDEVWKQKSLALQKKWNDMCLHLHPRFHQTNPGSERFASNALSMTSLCAPNMITSQTLQQPRLQQCRNVTDTIPMNPKLMNPILVSSRPAERANTPPGSPVRTDLVLGRPKLTVPEPAPKELVRDFFSSGPQKKLQELATGKLLDAADSFKKFLKSLVEKVWWQHDAASAVATTVAQCRLGNGRRRAAGSKGDIWLLFMGPDRAGKKKMASALSELVCGAHPVSISLGTRSVDEEPDPGFRGKTVVDRIAETVRRNPLSVIMLEDIDEADLLVKGSIKRAMERGRLADAHGREISLGNVIFILTTNWLPDNLKLTSHGNVLDDKKLASLASRGWQLRLSLSERSAKRRASWLHDEEDSRVMKPRKETCSSGLSFDLNETADVDEDKGDGSHNSSDLTVDHEAERERCYCPTDNKLISSSSHDLLSSVDDAIAFKPVDFGPIKRELANAVTRRFSAIVGERLPIEIPDEALEKITSGVWIGQTGMEEWIEKVLVPSFHELKPRLGTMSDDSLVARLEIETESDDGCGGGEWLPESIKVKAVEMDSECRLRFMVDM